MHVCQRWRRIIFASPRRLDLHLSCSYKIPIRKNLVFWPVGLPLIVDYRRRHIYLSPDDENDIAFALDHSHRVLRIDVPVTDSLLRRVSTIIQKSFPALTHLSLSWNTYQFPTPYAIIPERFLNRSAPRLQYLRLRGFSFPQLPTLLLSARNLVTLKIKEMPQIGYISPEAMVRGLIVLTKLTTLSISFREDTSLPDQVTSHPNPPIRAVLPALARFHYQGCSKYLEDFLAQVNTPQLSHLCVEYFMQQIQLLEVPQLSQFIYRTENLKIDHFRHAEVTFCYGDIALTLDCPQSGRRRAPFSLTIIDEEFLDMHVPCVVHVLSQLVAMFSKVDHLTVHEDHVFSMEIDITAEWLPFFRLFPAVEALHSTGRASAHIASAFEYTALDTANPGVMVTDVFPALYLMWLKGANNSDWCGCDSSCIEPVPVGSIEGFLSLRQLSGCPVTVVDTQDRFSEADRKPL